MKERQATVAELGTMFPLVDPEILQTIYAQNNFNMNLTVDALLVLSDPTYSETHGGTFFLRRIFCAMPAAMSTLLFGTIMFTHSACLQLLVAL